MSLGEEDLGVLMKTFVENIGEGSKEHSVNVKRQMAEGRFTDNDTTKLENYKMMLVSHFGGFCSPRGCAGGGAGGGGDISCCSAHQWRRH